MINKPITGTISISEKVLGEYKQSPKELWVLGQIGTNQDQAHIAWTIGSTEIGIVNGKVYTQVKDQEQTSVCEALKSEGYGLIGITLRLKLSFDGKIELYDSEQKLLGACVSDSDFFNGLKIPEIGIVLYPTQQDTIAYLSGLNISDEF
jgi:hypothetical protein